MKYLIHDSLPFLNAKNSNTECTMLTMIVRPNRYGLVSNNVS